MNEMPDFHNLMQWAAVATVAGGLWWRFRQWSAERDSLTRWRNMVDNNDKVTQDCMRRMEARQTGLERDWRGLYERLVAVEAQLKARG